MIEILAVFINNNLSKLWWHLILQNSLCFCVSPWCLNNTVWKKEISYYFSKLLPFIQYLFVYGEADSLLQASFSTLFYDLYFLLSPTCIPNPSFCFKSISLKLLLEEIPASIFVLDCIAKDFFPKFYFNVMPVGIKGILSQYFTNFVLSKVSYLHCFYLALEAALQTWDNQILHTHDNQLKLQRSQENKIKEL